jgi:hypothetical protein
MTAESVIRPEGRKEGGHKGRKEGNSRKEAGERNSQRDEAEERRRPMAHRTQEQSSGRQPTKKAKKGREGKEGRKRLFPSYLLDAET